VFTVNAILSDFVLKLNVLYSKHNSVTYNETSQILVITHTGKKKKKKKKKLIHGMHSVLHCTDSLL
jgi:hypothetical protein